MNAHKFSRLIYRLLLRLHPTAFRQRFGEEMLWIFDMSSGDGETAYMLWDGACSTLRQHARWDLEEEPAAAFCLEVRASGLTFAKVGQATVLGGVILLALASVLVREMPPESVFNQQPVCHQFNKLKTQAKLEMRK
jgi:hypothetical protein